MSMSPDANRTFHRKCKDLGCDSRVPQMQLVPLIYGNTETFWHRKSGHTANVRPLTPDENCRKTFASVGFVLVRKP